MTADIDRRIARTRAALHQALLALSLEKGYEAVTVREICVRANVGRSTFYANFPDKGALKRAGLATLASELKAESSGLGTDEAAPGFRFSRPMFDHGRAHLAHFRSVKGADRAMALDQVRHAIVGAVREELGSGSLPLTPDVPQPEAIQFIVGGFMALLVGWLERGAPEDPAAMDARFQQLAAGAVVPPPGQA